MNKMIRMMYTHPKDLINLDSQWPTMASLRYILMRRNGDYFLDYIDYSKNFDVVLKLLLVILGNHRNYCSKQCI